MTALSSLAKAFRSRPALATGIVWGTVIVLRLLVGGTVGMADNFDGHRLVCQLGLAAHPMPADQVRWAYITPRYDSYTWYGEACSAGGTGQAYLTTAVFPLLVAKWLTALSWLPGALDLRMLGVVYAALSGIAIGWTVHELPGPARLRVFIGSVIGLAAADSAVALDFVSPLADPAGSIGLLFLVPALLRLLRVAEPGWREIGAVALASAWTIGAKPQLSSLLIAVVPCLLLRPARPMALVRKLRPTARALRWSRRVLPLTACAALVGGTVAFQHAQSKWLNELVLYDGVFREILGHSPDVSGDLRWFGLDPGFASAAGATVVAPNSAAALPQYPQFLATASLGGMLTFYATHPDRLIGAADRGFVGLVATRPGYLGNYPAGTGHAPYAKECRICVAQTMFTIAKPLRWVVFPGLWLGAIALGLTLIRRRPGDAQVRSVAGTLAAFGVLTLSQFWLCVLSEGESDLQRHMVYTVLGTCLLGPLAAAAVLSSRSGATARSSADGVSDDATGFPQSRAGTIVESREPAASA